MLGVVALCAGASPVTAHHPAAATEAAPTQQEGGAGAQATFSAERDAFVRQARQALDKLKVQYNDWSARAAQAAGQARIAMDKKLAVAKTRLDAAAKKFDELKKADAPRWEKIKAGMQKAIADVKKSFE